MKPEKPITRKEMYLDVATGGSTELPSPVTREEKYLAKIAGESVDIPTPVTRYEMLLAAVAGESYTLTPVTRLEIYLAKAAGQDVEIPQPVTREEMYWFDYCGGTPTPPEREYTGAVPVTFIADGTPLIDLLISGNEEHSGTPTPDSPIIPQGTGERTGNLTPNQKITSNTYSYTIATHPLINALKNITPNENYTLSWEFSSNGSGGVSNQIRLYTSASGTLIKILQQGVSFTLTSEEIANIGALFCYFGVSNTDGYMDKLMLVEGSTALPYEPYGYKIPISSANTTTPVYLGEVETTRRVKKLVLTGEESWNTYRSTYYITVSDYYRMYDIGSHLSVCSHYPNIQMLDLPEMHYGLGGLVDGSTHTAWNGNIVFNPSPMISSLTDWKSYLAAQYAAGTPVTIWYVLVTEETGIVNEPLMRIGDYSDTLSMEQAGAQIPTANGSTTLDVETTVKPSEVYIKYRGEAAATLSTLSAEVSSPEANEEVNPEETEEEENGSEDVSLQYKPEAIE